MARRRSKANYALKGDLNVEFYAPSDGAALSKAQNLVVNGPLGLSKLFRLGRAIDEPLYWLEKSDEYLCSTGWMK